MGTISGFPFARLRTGLRNLFTEMRSRGSSLDGFMLVVMAISGSPREGAAQSSTSAPQRPPTGAIAGVAKSATVEPIVGAVIEPDGAELKATRDSLGRFHIPQVPAGHKGFIVRQLGFSLASFEASVPPDSTLVIGVTLQPVRSLDTVHVSAGTKLPGLARTGFY
jgi:hypothetical protein